jgi:hypothetical protein
VRRALLATHENYYIRAAMDPLFGGILAFSAVIVRCEKA